MSMKKFENIIAASLLSTGMLFMGWNAEDVFNFVSHVGYNITMGMSMREADIPMTEIDLSDTEKTVSIIVSSIAALANMFVAIFKSMKPELYTTSQRSSISNKTPRIIIDTDPTLSQESQVRRKPRLSYGKLQDIMGDVLSEYAQISSDTTVVVTMPAINDINVPKTAEFNEVLFEVLPLVDTINSYPRDKESSEHDEKLIQKLSDTWLEALEFARQTGLSGLTDTERRRAQAALNNVMSPTNEHEMKRNLELLENILSRVTYIDETTGNVNKLNVSEVLGKKEFVELISNKRLAIES